MLDILVNDYLPDTSAPKMIWRIVVSIWGGTGGLASRGVLVSQRSMVNTVCDCRKDLKYLKWQESPAMSCKEVVEGFIQLQMKCISMKSKEERKAKR